MKVIKFAPGLIPVLKHGTHDQKTHGSWAHGSGFGDFTLEEGADSKKLAIYSHPNGTRVIFQNLSKVESSSPMVKETLETIDGLTKKYPVPNLTFVVQSGEGGGIIPRGYNGACYSPAREQETEIMQGYLARQKMPLATDPSAPYIAIRQRVVAPDSVPRVTYTGNGGGYIRPEKTPEQNLASLKELITHEWGHALDTRTRLVSNTQFRGRDKESTSAYGNKNGREFFAETFAAFELGGLVKDKPESIPNYKKASEYLGMDSLTTKVSKEYFDGFITYENFETGEPLLIEDGLPLDFDETFAKHLPGEHDQKDHGSWATGGGVGYLSESTAKEIEESKALFQELIPANRTLKEVLTGYYYEEDWEILKDKLTRRYMAAGMGKNTAMLQARIDLGRVTYAMENEEEKAHWEKTVTEYERLSQDPNEPDREDYASMAKSLRESMTYAEEQVTNAFKNGDITIAAPGTVLEAVLTEGRYKNQFETRESGGLMDVGVRKVGEGLAVGVPAGTKLAERPVYGFLTTNQEPTSMYGKRKEEEAFVGTQEERLTAKRERDWQSILSVNSYEVDHYGAVRLVLKPEVRERTTATVGDSLRTGVMADNITNPTPDFTNMGIHKNGAPTHMVGTPIAPYIEAQIHGGVRASDIARIYAPADRVDEIKAMVQSKGFDIPVVARAGG